jgi:hypothetical protein
VIDDLQEAHSATCLVDLSRSYIIRSARVEVDDRHQECGHGGGVAVMQNATPEAGFLSKIGFITTSKAGLFMSKPRHTQTTCLSTHQHARARMSITL